MVKKSIYFVILYVFIVGSLLFFANASSKNQIKNRYTTEAINNTNYGPNAIMFYLNDGHMLIADRNYLECVDLENGKAYYRFRLQGDIVFAVNLRFSNDYFCIILKSGNNYLFQRYDLGNEKPYIKSLESFFVKGTEIIMKEDETTLVTMDKSTNIVYLYSNSKLVDEAKIERPAIIKKIDIISDCNDYKQIFAVYNGQNFKYIGVNNNRFYYPVIPVSKHENTRESILEEFEIKSNQFSKTFISAFLNFCAIYDGENFNFIDFKETTDDPIRYCVNKMKVPDFNTWIFDPGYNEIFFSGENGTYKIDINESLSKLSNVKMKLFSYDTFSYYEDQSLQTCLLGQDEVGGKPVCIFRYRHNLFNDKNVLSTFEGIDAEIIDIKLASIRKAPYVMSRVYFLTPKGLFRSEPIANVEAGYT